MKGSGHISQMAGLHAKALKRPIPRLRGTQSSLLRQRGLADKRLPTGAGDLKKAKSAAKGATAKELAEAKNVKKVAPPVKKLAAKDAGALQEGGPA